MSTPKKSTSITTTPHPVAPAAEVAPPSISLRQFFAGFNLNSFFLIVIIIFLGMLVFKPAPPPPLKYRYMAAKVTKTSLVRAEEKMNEKHSRWSGHKVETFSAAWPDLLRGGFSENTEYIGTLGAADDGSVWVIVRTPEK